MTKTEIAAIQNVISRLKEPRCGGAEPFSFGPSNEVLAPGFEGVSRVYLNSWVIPALGLLLPGDGRDPELARKLAGR